MQNGTYRLHYNTAGHTSTGVVVFDGGTLWACDPIYFMTGSYRRDGNCISGTVSFRRHTDRPDRPDFVPDRFELEFEGVAGEQCGQFDLTCPAMPGIEGNATFTWLTGLNAKAPSLEASLA